MGLSWERLAEAGRDRARGGVAPRAFFCAAVSVGGEKSRLIFWGPRGRSVSDSSFGGGGGPLLSLAGDGGFGRPDRSGRGSWGRTRRGSARPGRGRARGTSPPRAFFVRRVLPAQDLGVQVGPVLAQPAEGGIPGITLRAGVKVDIVILARPVPSVRSGGNSINGVECLGVVAAEVFDGAEFGPFVCAAVAVRAEKSRLISWGPRGRYIVVGTTEGRRRSLPFPAGIWRIMSPGPIGACALGLGRLAAVETRRSWSDQGLGRRLHPGPFSCAAVAVGGQKTRLDLWGPLSRCLRGAPSGGAAAVPVLLVTPAGLPRPPRATRKWDASAGPAFSSPWRISRPKATPLVRNPSSDSQGWRPCPLGLCLRVGSRPVWRRWP
jgi:hypothetical protein